MQTPTDSAIRQYWLRRPFGHLAYVTDHIWYIDPAELNSSNTTEVPTSATQVAKADGVG